MSKKPKGTFTYNPEMWPARLKIFREVFPWINDRIGELAGLPPDATIGPGGKHEDNLAFIRAHELYLDGGNATEQRERVVAIHNEQNAAWTSLTNLTPLDTDTAWRAAGRAARAPHEAIEALDMQTLAECITEWALSLVAQQPSQTRVEDEPQVEWSKAESPTEWTKLFGGTARQFVKACEEGKIRHKRWTSKLYQVDIRDIPTTKR
ncbi:MAG: hypothetical protein HYV60_01300 [Planctomycetia bacterium]|nr:hypothetical protein [Planctomycetia bacterium]